MRLDDYCAVFDRSRFPLMDAREHPERESVLDARNILAAAVVDDEFLADCISLELDRIARGNEYWGLDPFFTIDDLGIRFALGYWPPGGTPGAHEHTAWTITAVCCNYLEVITYDRDESYRRRDLVVKNRFEAPAGRTGFIYDPCIHEPVNTSDAWSLSIHILSPRDGEVLEDYDQCIPSLAIPPEADVSHPYASVVMGRRRQYFLVLLARILSGMKVDRAPSLIERCREMAQPRTRRVIERDAQLSFGGDPLQGAWKLHRTHDDLVLDYRESGDMVMLHADTPHGSAEELRVSSHAREAIAFAVRTAAFDARDLPGMLSLEEQLAIAESLENTGLFRRIPQ